MSKAISVEEKIEYIEKTRSFGEIRQAWFPPSASTEYYFVSYCHADYKAVFRDLFGMQEVDPEFSVWYDRELIAGKDWKAEAEKHIYDFNCKGVIFYVSENSVKSPAVLDEIKMTRDAGKAFLPIVLPSSSGEYLSGEQLLERNGSDKIIDNSAVELYRTMLGKNITYLKLSDESSHKVDAVKKSLKGMPLLRFAKGSVKNEDVVNVVATNNVSVIEISKSDFTCGDENLSGLDKMAIGICAFANCANLKTIEMPNSVVSIGPYAFLGCRSIKRITLPESVVMIRGSVFSGCYELEEVNIPISHIPTSMFENCKKLKKVKLDRKMNYINDMAFVGCESLEEFDFNADDERAFADVYKIGDYAFRGCTGLKRISLPFGLNYVEKNVFDGCSSLEAVDFPETVIGIEDMAFRDCVSLKSVDLTKTVNPELDSKIKLNSAMSYAWYLQGLEGIGDSAFSNCTSLTEIKLPRYIKAILRDVFFGSAIRDIYYLGTVEEWNNIQKDHHWDRGMLDYTVHCLDGDIKKCDGDMPDHAVYWLHGDVEKVKK
ncbi:MAG: leucine-rich repeat protein [Clostridiales bacterium]|nr:leucine-rich repeat protein [Clostridiales bacterium]